MDKENLILTEAERHSLIVYATPRLAKRTPEARVPYIRGFMMALLAEGRLEADELAESARVLYQLAARLDKAEKVQSEGDSGSSSS